MDGANGKAVNFPAVSQETAAGNPSPQTLTITEFATYLFPLTPAPFSGKTASAAIGRVLLYGGAAAALWSRNKKLAYWLAGAAAISAGTSLMAGK